MGRGTTLDSRAHAVGRRGHAPRERVRGRFHAQRAEVEHLLRHDPNLAANHIALVTLIGSQAYGLAHEGSDSDYRGIYVADFETLLGLEEPPPEFVLEEADFTVFEIGKFAKLAVAATPNVLEALWGPELHSTELGRMLRSNRHLFLSQRARAAYLGFAFQQLKKIERYDRLGRQAKREKSARHLFRLFEQAEQVLRAGDLELRVRDVEGLQALSRLSYEEIEDHFGLLEDWLRHMPSDLPERVDFRAISDLVHDIRMVAVEEHRLLRK